MCFYVSKIYDIEILQMKAEFLTDDEGEIWLHHVENLWTREKRRESFIFFTYKTSYTI